MKRIICSGMRTHAGPTLVGMLAAMALSGCVVTSPYWDYVPASTSAPIPFQAWTTSNAAPVIVECATATTGHGNPADGEASYIVAASMPVSASASLDAQGVGMYSASANVALPSDCWDYFGSYDFWQANVRISQTAAWSGEVRKVVFSSFDLTGLECLGRENGKRASWFGFLNQGCEKNFLGTSTKIPYIVMRIDGFAAGRSGVRPVSAPTPGDRSAVRPDVLIKGAAPVQQIVPLPKEVLEQVR